MKENNGEVIAVLDNIRSAHNVGSIFRTADGAGITTLYLVGQTPAPIDRFGRERSDIKKVALGAEKIVEWKYFKESRDAVSALAEEGYTIVAVEQSDRAVDYRSFEMRGEKKIALVCGNEVEGVSIPFLEAASHIIDIPMNGEKESLNVAVAFGIIAYGILN